MKKTITLHLRRFALDGAQNDKYELVKLQNAVVVRSVVGLFGADHRVGDLLDEKQVASFQESPLYDIVVTKQG